MTGRVDERVPGAIWKSEPSSQGIDRLPQLLAESMIEDTIEGMLSETPGSAWSKE